MLVTYHSIAGAVSCRRREWFDQYNNPVRSNDAIYKGNKVFSFSLVSSVWVILTDALSSVSSVTKPAATLIRAWAVEAICIQVTLGCGRLTLVNIWKKKVKSQDKSQTTQQRAYRRQLKVRLQNRYQEIPFQKCLDEWLKSTVLSRETTKPSFS